MLLGALGAVLLDNILAGKGMNRARKGFVKVGYGSSVKPTRILIPPCCFTHFEVQKYYQNEPRFNGIYSRDNLPDKVRDGKSITKLLC